MQISSITSFFKQLQQNICDGLEQLDGEASFISDKWERAEGGGGDSRVILNGNVFEKGGVNFSHVFGTMPEFLQSEARKGSFFQATGVSIVIHPQNPYVPIIHMNVRYFEMRDCEDGEITDAWFGGGIDLSPAYPNANDAHFFHSSLKNVCDLHNSNYYNEFKAWCDKYFTIVHRKQMRGIGGVFFDHLRGDDETKMNAIFEFVKEVGNSFLPIYSEIVNRNKSRLFADEQKQWQFIRRGYYAEFNLVYDRGTHFGLKTNGRIESILMSLPPQAGWKYNFVPDEGSEEAESLAFFQPNDWVV